VSLSGCAGPLQSVKGTYDARTVPVRLAGQEISVTYVKPTVPRTPEMLIVYVSGDAGYRGVSGAIIQHLAAARYDLVTYDARELIAHARDTSTHVKIHEVAAVFETILVDARRSEGIAETVPVVVIGYSRGANMVVLSASIDSLRRYLAGAVAIALTPRTEFLELPTPVDPQLSVMVDEEGQIKTYAAIPFAESLPFAVIQGTRDSYIGADDAQKQFGPDTPRRHFYKVDGNHSFRRARGPLMKDLDDSLAWIVGLAAAN
jgi:Bacterial virulence protein (VirJ)